jgi:MATE family multidrug resistance protein
VAAVSQPLNSLSFVTDGIHWGTSDYPFLRNAVGTATVTGAVLLVLLEGRPAFDLTDVWLITSVWIAVRAGFGVARIWPGFGDAPLRQP